MRSSFVALALSATAALAAPNSPLPDSGDTFQVLAIEAGAALADPTVPTSPLPEDLPDTVSLIFYSLGQDNMGHKDTVSGIQTNDAALNVAYQKCSSLSSRCSRSIPSFPLFA